MSVTVGTLLVELRAKTDAFTKGMSDARKFSFDSASGIADSIGQIGKAFDRLKFDSGQNIAKSLKTISGIAAGVGVGIATAMAAAGTAMVKTAVDSADKFNKLSQSTGVAVETLTGFAYVAKLTGLDTDSMAKGLEKASKAAMAAASGNGEAAKAFKLLGVAVTGAGGQLRPVEDIVLDVADKFQGMKDGAAKTALSMQIFGRAGAALIPMLNQGRDGISNLLEEAKRLGVVLDSETAAGAERFHDNLERLEVRVQGVGLQLMKSLLPSLEAFSNELTSAAQQQDFKAMIDEMATGLKYLVVALDSAITGFRLFKAETKGQSDSRLSVALKGLAPGPLGPILASLTSSGKETAEIEQLLAAFEQRKNAILNPQKVPTFGNGLIGPPLAPGYGKSNPTLPGDAVDSSAINAARVTMIGIQKEVAAGEENIVKEIELKYKQLLEKVKAIFEKFPALRKQYAGIEVEIEKAKGVQLTLEYQKELDAANEAVKKAVKERSELTLNLGPVPAAVMPSFKSADPFTRYFDSLTKVGATVEEIQQRIVEMGRLGDQTWTNMLTPVERYAQQVKILNELLHPSQPGAKPYLDQDTHARALQAAWDEMSHAMDQALLNTQKFSAGAQVAFKQYAEAAKNGAQQAYDVFSNALKGMDSAVHDFFRNGKADWAGLAKDTWADVMTAMFRKNVLGPIAGKLAEAFGMPADALNRPDGSSANPWSVIVQNFSAMPIAGMTSSSNGEGSGLNGFLGKIGSWIGGLFNKGGGAGGIDTTSTGTDTVGGIFEGFRNGGVMTPSGALRLPRFASGGISHHAAIFGEGGPEAAIPLPDGRNVPVKIDGKLGNTVVANFYGVTDADSFKRSQGQILSLLGSAVDKAQRRNG